MDTNNYKYCHYMDEDMDCQFQHELTYDTYIKDLDEGLFLLPKLLSMFDDFYKLPKAEEKYSKFEIDPVEHKIILHHLIRMIKLISHKTKEKFEGQKTELTSLIEESKVCEVSGFIKKFFEESKIIDKNDFYKNMITELLEGEDKIRNINHIPSIAGLTNAIKNVNLYVKKSITEIEDILKNTEEAKDEYFIDLFHHMLKLQVMTSNFPAAYIIPHTDLFNLPENSEEWINLKKNTVRITKYSKDEIKSAQKKLVDFVVLANAALSQGYKFEGDFLKVVGSGVHFCFYFLANDMKHKQNKIFSLKPDKEVVKRIWNLLDTAVIKDLALIPIQGIKYRKTFYLKRMEKEIDREAICNFNKMIKLDKRTSYIDSSKDKRKFNFAEQVNVNEGELKTEMIRELNSNDEIILDDIEGHKEENYVQVKLLFNNMLLVPQFKPSCSMFSCCMPESNFTRNSLIIHVHGGGFVAMSSTSHECYLRKWANATGIPIVSIDYRLAPEHAYPKALDDVWQAYNWIINHAADIFQITLDKIILIGDSAGGNLILSLTYLLIFLNKRVPDALFLVYPASRCSIKNYTMSSMLCLTDKILSYPFIKICMDSYIQDYSLEDDMFLHPILMDHKIIKLLPEIKVFVGTNDPLRDDIINYVHILTSLKKDVKLFEFSYFPHGFLNYDLPMMMPEASITNDTIIQEFEKFLNKDKTKSNVV